MKLVGWTAIANHTEAAARAKNPRLNNSSKEERTLRFASDNRRTIMNSADANITARQSLAGNTGSHPDDCNDEENREPGHCHVHDEAPNPKAAIKPVKGLER